MPPRPSASISTAAQLAFKSSASAKISSIAHGRTVVYKSPSLDTNTSHNTNDSCVSFKQLVEIDQQSQAERPKATLAIGKSDSFSFKVNTNATPETITSSAISLSTIINQQQNTTYDQKMVANVSTTSTTIQCNTSQPTVARRAEFAFPPAPPVRSSTTTSSVSMHSTSPPKTATRTKQSATTTTPSAYENIEIEQYRSNRTASDLDTDHRRSVKYEANPLEENENAPAAEEVKKSPVARPRMNAPQMQRRVLQPVNTADVGTIIDQGHAIDSVVSASAADARPTETIKNLRNSTYKLVAEKLFTEIATNAQSGQAKLEHCIPVRTPSPPRFQIKPDHTLINSVDNSSLDKLPMMPNKINESSAKKVTFHEMLISELTGMHQQPTTELAKSTIAPVLTASMHPSSDDQSARPAKDKRCRRYSSSGSADSASSPNGTQRMARIRTADWVEVGDNGKEVLLSSCQISLEDSGLEDEERLDDGSSGVGDSWDSVRDIEDR